MKTNQNDYCDFESIPCIICGQNNTEIISRKGRETPIHISICKNDGLVYLTPRWKKEKYEEFGKQQYDNNYRPAIFDEHLDKIKCERYGIAKELWARINTHHKLEIKTILDVGSGMGWYLNYIKSIKNNISMSAIESSEQCIEHLKTKVGAKVIAADIDADWHKTNKNKFDLIIARHVLEHFMNPLEALRKMQYALSNTGVLYFAVPDMMSSKGSLEKEWFTIVHTYYFNKQTFTALTGLAGFEIEFISTNDNELWGILKKGKPVNLQINSTYLKQLYNIKLYRKKYFIKSLIMAIPRKIILFLPISLKSLLKGKLKKYIEKFIYH